MRGNENKYFYLLFLALLIWTVIDWTWKQIRRRVPKKEPVPWEPIEQPASRQFEVEMDVVEEEAITGSDTGIAWVENGALFFAGTATSFAITSDLIDWQWAPSGLTLRPFDRQIRFMLNDAAGAAKRRVQFDVPFGAGYLEHSQLADDILSLRDSKFNSQLRQAPPTELGPGSYTHRELRLLFLRYSYRFLVCTAIPFLLLAATLLLSLSLSFFSVVFGAWLVLAWKGNSVRELRILWEAMQSLKRIQARSATPARTTTQTAIQ